MSTPLAADALLPFVPSGADFDLARRFFAEFGFEELWENDGYAGFRSGSVAFILQRFDEPTFASNLMLRLEVPDLAAWWDDIAKRQLDAGFPGVKLKAPTDFPWGREAHVIDPAGVCWHIAQTST